MAYVHEFIYIRKYLNIRIICMKSVNQIHISLAIKKLLTIFMIYIYSSMIYICMYKFNKYITYKIFNYIKKYFLLNRV